MDGARDEVVFVGTPDGLEARLVPEAGIEFIGLASAGFDRGSPLTLLSSGIRVLASTVRAVRLVRRLRPDAVVAFGGYVALPVGLAAVLTRVPLICHEQNALPGLANRLLSRFARVVAVTYPNSVERLTHPDRAIVTGNPVRAAFGRVSRDEARRAFDLPDDHTVLLAFGGSRGARRINEAIVRWWPALREVPRLVVVHVAGRLEVAGVRERMAFALEHESARYRLFPYIEDMASVIAAADVVFARAGATSIAEITAVGRAAILVPYPYATDDHQTLNARALAAAGAAIVIPDGALDDAASLETVLSVVRDEERRVAMAEASVACGRVDAAERVASLVREVARRGEVHR